MNTKLIALATVASIACASSAFAGTRTNQVDQRIENQEQRINAGVASGQLTKKEARHDRRKLRHTEKALKRDEAAHNGHITKAEQHNLNKRLNNSSSNIRKQRHNAAAEAPAQ